MERSTLATPRAAVPGFAQLTRAAVAPPPPVPHGRLPPGVGLCATLLIVPAILILTVSITPAAPDRKAPDIAGQPADRKSPVKPANLSGVWRAHGMAYTIKHNGGDAVSLDCENTVWSAVGHWNARSATLIVCWHFAPMQGNWRYLGCYRLTGSELIGGYEQSDRLTVVAGAGGGWEVVGKLTADAFRREMCR